MDLAKLQRPSFMVISNMKYAAKIKDKWMDRNS